jgi:hypothetical protein
VLEIRAMLCSCRRELERDASMLAVAARLFFCSNTSCAEAVWHGQGQTAMYLCILGCYLQSQLKQPTHGADASPSTGPCHK